MVPTKNRVYCHNSGKTKMLFEDEKKAKLFLKFNTEEIKSKSGHSPVVSYFCIVCGGWHVTSQVKHPNYKSTTEKVLERYSKVGEGLTGLEELEKEEQAEFLKHQVKITNQITNFEKAIQTCDAKVRRQLLKRIFKNLEFTKSMDLKDKQIRIINQLVDRLIQNLTPEETEKLLSTP
jgi:hypothetical protein